MAPLNIPPLPATLKPIQHYLKTATDYDSRDPSTAYWCRLYALQQGLTLDKKSKEAVLVLTTLMGWLETAKKELKNVETVSSEIVAQAHIENHAVKLFNWADGEDRAGKYSKNVVKAFYTAGMLLDVCSTFGEMNEEILQQKKYAKWRAAHLHNCLKTGETPSEAAPKPDEQFLDDSEREEFENSPKDEPGSGAGAQYPSDAGHLPAPYTAPTTPYVAPTASYVAQPTPVYNPVAPDAVATTSQTSLGPEQVAQAQKLCKYASSALAYDDIPTAIDNLQKALRLLQTGKQ